MYLHIWLCLCTNTLSSPAMTVQYSVLCCPVCMYSSPFVLNFAVTVQLYILRSCQVHVLSDKFLPRLHIYCTLTVHTYMCINTKHPLWKDQNTVGFRLTVASNTTPWNAVKMVICPGQNHPTPPPTSLPAPN
jgi:hypothetical protein